MKRRTHVRTLLLGLGMVTAASVGAWSAGREAGSGAGGEGGVLPVASAATAAGGVQWDLPVTRNASVEKWIGFLSGRNSERTRTWLERSGKYGPMIQRELRERGMPEDLIYLALIESGFSPNAYSHAKAAGIWQFIAETGQRYGLEVSTYVDERRDPVKATHAALDYLQELYDDFGSWYLAAAAYNTGENRVRRILRERANNARGDEELFWRIAPYLPRETRDYVPLMLAAGHIGKEPARYGFGGLEYQDELTYATVTVPGATALSTVAKAALVSERAVRDLNPHLIRGRTPPGRTYAVRIPVAGQHTFAANFATVKAQAEAAARAQAKAPKKYAVAAGTKKHVVRKGENLTTIARKHHISLAKLRAANRGVNPRLLKPGRVLRIPA